MTENVNDYGWQSPEQPGSCDYITPQILELVQNYPNERILDLGCGNGALCGALIDRFDSFVVGVEYDSHGARIAQEACPDARIFTYGVQDDPNQLLDHVGGKFDLVISTEVIEHLYSPQLLPRYAEPILKPHGKLIVSTPYHGYLKNLAIARTNHWDTHHTPRWDGGISSSGAERY